VVVCRIPTIFINVAISTPFQEKSSLPEIDAVSGSAENLPVPAKVTNSSPSRPFFCTRVQRKRWLSTAPRNSGVASAPHRGTPRLCCPRMDGTCLLRAKPLSPVPVTLLLRSSGSWVPVRAPSNLGAIGAFFEGKPQNSCRPRSWPCHRPCNPLLFPRAEAERPEK